MKDELDGFNVMVRTAFSTYYNLKSYYHVQPSLRVSSSLIYLMQHSKTLRMRKICTHPRVLRTCHPAYSCHRLSHLQEPRLSRHHAMANCFSAWMLTLSQMERAFRFAVSVKPCTKSTRAGRSPHCRIRRCRVRNADIGDSGNSARDAAQGGQSLL